MTGKTDELCFEGKGITSKQLIEVRISRQQPGQGIVFRVPDRKEESEFVEIKAVAANVAATWRNVTLGSASNRLCLVEHILAAMALWGLQDLLIEVNGPEIPLDDGSAKFWLDLLEQSGWERKTPACDIELKQALVVKKGDRLLMAVPDGQFSLNYMIDWDHPQIGKCWQSWSSTQDPRQISDARTFATAQEHAMFGITEDSVSLTADGFSKELRWADEPVRHKLLDLIGDLSLCGVNPQRLKARFISIKGGHEMDVELAKQLAEILSSPQ